MTNECMNRTHMCSIDVSERVLQAIFTCNMNVSEVRAQKMLKSLRKIINKFRFVLYNSLTYWIFVLNIGIRFFLAFSILYWFLFFIFATPFLLCIPYILKLCSVSIKRFTCMLDVEQLWQKKPMSSSSSKKEWLQKNSRSSPSEKHTFSFCMFHSSYEMKPTKKKNPARKDWNIKLTWRAHITKHSTTIEHHGDRKKGVKHSDGDVEVSLFRCASTLIPILAP